jgi:hypothetical protein
MNNNQINGFYDDDGNKINPDILPVPGLCITCRSYETENQEENVLCSLNRYDQHNSLDFICGAYQNKTTS